MRASLATGTVGIGEAEFAVREELEMDEAFTVRDWMDVVALKECSKVRRSTASGCKDERMADDEPAEWRRDVGQTLEQFEGR